MNSSANNLTVLENAIDAVSGMWRVHLISNAAIANPEPMWGEGCVTQEGGAWHFRKEQPMRGVIRLQVEGNAARLGALWRRDGYKNLRTAMVDAAKHFEEKTNIRAEYCYMKALPKDIPDGHVFDGMGIEVMLFAATWMMPNYIFVCARKRGL